MNPVEYFVQRKADTEKAKNELLADKEKSLTKAEELKEKEKQAIVKKDIALLRKLTLERKEAEADAEAYQSMADALFDYDDAEVYEKWISYVAETNKELDRDLIKLRDSVAVTYTLLLKVLPKINKAYATKHKLITLLHAYQNGATSFESYLLDTHAELKVDNLKKLMTMFSDKLYEEKHIDYEDISRFNEWQIPYREDIR